MAGGKQTPDRVTNPAAKRAEIYLKRARAAELRRAGYRWDDIAAAVGYSDKGAAYHAVEALMREHRSLAYQEIALYRQESLDRLTELLKAIWPMALAGSEKHVAEARRIISQIGDLTGEKAPVKVEVGESDVDRALRELTAELDRRSAAAAGQAPGVQAPPSGDHQG